MAFTNYHHGLQDGTLYKSFNLTSAIIAMLVVIPAFFIGKMFGGNLTGLMSGLVMALHPAYISRSVAGYVSTDGYNVLFPLLIIWMVFLAFKSKETWKQITFASFAGLFVGIFSRTWSAWFFIAIIAIVSAVGYLAFVLLKEYIQNKKISRNVKGPSIIIGAMLVSITVFVSYFTSFKSLISLPLLLIGSGGGAGLGIQNAIGGNGLWPNVLTTVAELARPSTMQIVAQLGGSTIFIIAMMGIILSLLPVKNWNKYEYGIFFGGLVFAYLATTTLPMDLAINNGIDYSITFTALILLPILAGFVNLLFSKHEVNLVFAVFTSVLFVTTLFTTTQGVRFTLLVVPAIALALAIALGRVISYMKQSFSKRNWNLDIGYIAVILIAAFVFLPVAQAGINTGHQRVPGISDAWYDSLTEIKETTTQDTILTSWWDFGHWFKTLADRRVTFDGTSQSTPMAHWVGKALMTSNEDESVGILRMLACGSYTGFDTLGTKLYDKTLVSELSSKEFLETYNHMSNVVLIERQEALNYYLNLGISESDALEILELTHCAAPPVIFITSNDMVGKSPVWGHFGLWNFEKAYVARVARRQGNVQAVVEDIASTLNTNSERAQTLYFDARQLVGERAVSNFISPRPSYLTQTPLTCVDEANRVICQTNIGVGQSQGFTNVITGITIDKQNTSNSRLIVTVVESATNEVVTRTNVEPAGVIISGNRTQMANPAIDLDVVIEYINGVPNALIASESLADSMFTRLYFWDGIGTERFEKFSEYQNSFAGHRVKNWKVVW
jgi:dolichyl-phosphooligosaccharide-protein glycotransferase